MISIRNRAKARMAASAQAEGTPSEPHLPSEASLADLLHDISVAPPYIDPPILDRIQAASEQTEAALAELHDQSAMTLRLSRSDRLALEYLKIDRFTGNRSLRSVILDAVHLVARLRSLNASGCKLYVTKDDEWLLLDLRRF